MKLDQIIAEAGLGLAERQRRDGVGYAVAAERDTYAKMVLVRVARTLLPLLLAEHRAGKESMSTLGTKAALRKMRQYQHAVAAVEAAIKEIEHAQD